jgi:hypothetical protein
LNIHDQRILFFAGLCLGALMDDGLQKPGNPHNFASCELVILVKPSWSIGLDLKIFLSDDGRDLTVDDGSGELSPNDQICITGWWFGTFELLFHIYIYIGNNHPN